MRCLLGTHLVLAVTFSRRSFFFGPFYEQARTVSMRLGIDLHQGGVQASLVIRQADRTGPAGRALLDTGSSRMIVRSNLLPDPIAASTRYDAFVHFMRDKLPARIVLLRARLRLGGVDLTGDRDGDLQIAVVTNAALPHGVDAVLGLCVPIVRAPSAARFVDAFRICEMRFAFGHGVLDLRTDAPPRADVVHAHPLLRVDELLRIDPSATNVHYALSTPQAPRVVFDTGSAHTIVPSSSTGLELGGRALAFGRPVTWDRVGGGVGIVLGMDTLGTLRRLTLLRPSATSEAWRIDVE